MAKYGVVRTDNMTGTDVRSELVSVKYMGTGKNTATEIENGSVLKASDLMDGEREVFLGEDVMLLIFSSNTETDHRLLLISKDVLTQLQTLSESYFGIGIRMWIIDG